MTLVPMDTLPDSARVWIFGSDRPVSRSETTRILSVADAFLRDWTAHGTPLVAAREWRRERLLVVAVDEERAPPSGCSIDALVRSLKELEEELEVGLVGKGPVWYLEGEEVRAVSRAAFRRLAEGGEVGPDTVVFDPTLIRLGEIRDGGLERPAAESWHGRAFLGRRVPGPEAD